METKLNVSYHRKVIKKKILKKTSIQSWWYKIYPIVGSIQERELGVMFYWSLIIRRKSIFILYSIQWLKKVNNPGSAPLPLGQTG